MRLISKKGRGQLVLKLAAGVVAAGLSIAGSARAATPPAVTPTNNQFFDWFVNTTPSYVPSPFLSNNNAGAVNAFLQQMPAGAIRAVKIEKPINLATANLIFNNPSYHVSYVLGDIEGSSAAADMKNLANQVRFVNGQNGTKTNSTNAYVGDFGFTGLSNDVTLPSNYVQANKNTHSFTSFSNGDYSSAKLNMSMPVLYPGSPSMRNLAAGNSSIAPNIRSGLFVMPILRLSQTTVGSNGSDAIVPWVAPFNNWGNLALDTDRNASNGYKFVPGVAIPAKNGLPGFSAAQTTNQMLSHRDFATMVAHYRLRGADSFVTFEQGIDGYINEQKRTDAKTGWTEPHIDSIFKATDATLVLGADSDYKNGNNKKDYNANIIVDGVQKSDEDAGALFSGVYSLTLKKLDVLLSNMDDDDHSLTLPSKIAGFDLKTKTFSLDGGSNLLVEYKLTTSGVNKGWSVALQNVPFQAIENSRNHFGIPEPGTVSLAAMAGLFAISRRRRSASDKAPAKPRNAGPAGLIGMNMMNSNVIVL